MAGRLALVQELSRIVLLGRTSLCRKVSRCSCRLTREGRERRLRPGDQCAELPRSEGLAFVQEVPGIVFLLRRKVSGARTTHENWQRDLYTKAYSSVMG